MAQRAHVHFLLSSVVNAGSATDQDQHCGALDKSLTLSDLRYPT